MSNTTNAKVKGSLFAKASARLAGISRDIPSTSNLSVAGQSVSQPALVSQLEAFIGLCQDLAKARTSVQQKLGLVLAATPGVREFIVNLDAALKGLLGPKNPQLGDFGIKPAHRSEPSAETKAAAAALGKQTRAIRHTHGKRQKALVTVTGRAGIVLVGPNGQPLPGFTRGPVAPTEPDGTTGSSTGGNTGNSGK
ncbi:MAG: hypothetical protein ACYCWW_19195 [Deltaproteobacteria bacterium]